MSQQRIVISNSTLIVAATLFFLGVLLWQLQSLIIVVMISVVLASALAPTVNAAEKLGLPRFLAVLLVYLVLIGGLTGAAVLIGPTVVEQIQRLIRKLPNYLETLRLLAQDIALRLGMTDPEELDPINRLFDTKALTSWLIRSSQQLLVRSYGVTRGIIGGFISVILSVVLSGYMLSGSRRLLKGLISLFPSPWNARLEAQIHPVALRMGGYIQGRVLVSGILGVVITISLRALGISEFALGLGAIAGVTNLIPFFGPVLGSIPALIVATANGGWTVLWVLVLFVVVQNVETYVLDPLLVGNTVRLHPLYQLLAVIGGAQVLGILGALIVPPWVAGSATLIENLYLKPKLLAEKNQPSPSTPLPIRSGQ
ncbi:AI-2E family transporter [Euhalothece natronophila Z-M001]|uniref:AI-2E family transporter n=1 Tax=Euhalothece natronophila Z-M001 TaxID=522448 RepID=A0A5B8NL64_9CHRO|nr:AI-2E family transporter [Euhalothece natronophila]QDZ39774.1 AI-2E family transporter [Euhalothece natronophila Z-M001]